MYARTITIDAKPEAVDNGITFVRDTVFPQLTSMPGCIGMSLVTDPISGRCIVTSAWDSERAMRDSEGPVGPIRQRGAEVFGGSPQVDEWELAVMHRDHHAPDGAWVRSTWIQTAPHEIDANIEVFKTLTLPVLDQFDGFCSASLLVDRQQGRALATIAYDSRDALEGTRGQADQLRSRTASAMSGGVLDVREFELAMAHLHAPELV